MKAFVVKELGPLTYFLGVEVAHYKEGLFLSQHKYTIDVLKKFKLDGSKPMPTLISSKLSSSKGNTDMIEFQSGIGGIQYFTLTRPNITFSVNKLT